jgi:PAS domain S-box-containing protein
MTNRKLSVISLTVETLIAVILGLLILTGYGIIKKSIYQNAEQTKRHTINHISAILSYAMETEKEKFALVVQNIDEVDFDRLSIIDDFFIVSQKGYIEKIKKKESATLFFEQYDFRDNELFIGSRNFMNNTVYIYGPYFSSIIGKRTISLAMKQRNYIYVANLNMQRIAEFIHQIRQSFDDTVFFTDRDGIVLLSLNDKFGLANIDMNPGNILIKEKPYFHSIAYNPDLNVYLHLLSSIKEQMIFIEQIGILTKILLVLLFLIWIIKTIGFYKLLLIPLKETIETITEWKIENPLYLPRMYFYEVDLLKTLFLELSEKIRAEVTEEKRIKTFYEKIIDSSPNIIITTDLNDKISAINKQGKKYFGEVKKGTKIFRILYFDSDELKIIKNIKKADSGYDKFIEKKILVNNTERVFDIIIYNISDNATVRSIVYILIDIGERKLIEEQLVQTQKMESVGILAGGFAHDFNNILTTIMGSLDFYRYAQNEEKKLELIDTVKDASVKAADLVKQIQIFSKQDVVSLESVTLENVIKSMIEKNRGVIPNKIRIDLLFNETETITTANEKYLRQISLNLLVNAIEALEHKEVGIIQIDTSVIEIDNTEAYQNGLSYGGKYARLSIADNGEGIDEEIRDKIFDPFFTTKPKGTQKGVGLGLAIAYSEAKKMGGAIAFESEKDKGSTFYLYLPIETRERPRSLQDMMLPERPKQNLSVLIADDDPGVCKLGKNFLSLMGYTAFTATNGKEAVEIIANEKIDLVILDLIMPVYDGYLTINFIRENNPEIPVIVITGYFEKTNIDEVKKFSCVKAFIDKPFTMSRFTKIIDKVMAEKSNNK